MTPPRSLTVPGIHSDEVLFDGWTWARSFTFAANVARRVTSTLDYHDRDEVANQAVLYAVTSYQGRCPWKCYLARAARQVAVRISKRQRRHGFTCPTGNTSSKRIDPPEYLGEPMEGDVSFSPDPAASLVYTEMLATLPPKTASIVGAMAEGATHEEAAKAHGYTTHGAVWRHIVKARKALTEYQESAA